MCFSCFVSDSRQGITTGFFLLGQERDRVHHASSILPSHSSTIHHCRRTKSFLDQALKADLCMLGSKSPLSPPPPTRGVPEGCTWVIRGNLRGPWGKGLQQDQGNRCQRNVNRRVEGGEHQGQAGRTGNKREVQESR